MAGAAQLPDTQPPGGTAMADTRPQPFVTDLQQLHRQAREQLSAGARTDTAGGELGMCLTLLNAVLATEVVCVRRYTRHALCAAGPGAEAVKAAFGRHAREEQGHALRLAERIQQLGGRPDFNLGGLMSSGDTHDEEGRTLVELLRENLAAERVVIETYRELIPYFEERDPTTRRLLEELLDEEEAHAKALHTLLEP
ncbi:ferritin-like domain-containing protein [Corallococcus caeni]|uniref:Ferritin-like domain-containing protein n=2 Tax=Corallococcus caeni TaxID=3082388 RepID=A0ABQ6QQ01_9BACT|nr:ferritin-like domain-containing protein [Corallococcus sp. NO1]